VWISVLVVHGNAWFSKSTYCQDKHENSQCRWISCVIHCEALASGTLSAALKDNLAVIIRTVKFVKTNAVNTRLFTMLFKDMDSSRETLLFHTSVW